MATPDSITLATGPVTWGVDFADGPENPPWQLVLDEIAASPVSALELGPVGYLPEDESLLRNALASRGLIAVGSFVFEDLHDPAQRTTVLDVALRACRAIRAASGSVLVVIDRPGAERAATAGRPDVARRLGDDEWRSMLEVAGDIAAIAVEHGLNPAFHPHAGSYVEFADEIERLLDETAFNLCLDTGHAAYAGMVADQALVAYGPRLAHVHLKDVRPSVLERVRDEGLDFWTAIAEGVFCPIGDGVVDVSAVLGALDRVGYRGYVTLEQDRVPGSGSPLEDLEQSVAVTRRARVGETA